MYYVYVIQWHNHITLDFSVHVLKFQSIPDCYLWEVCRVHLMCLFVLILWMYCLLLHQGKGGKGWSTPRRSKLLFSSYFAVLSCVQIVLCWDPLFLCLVSFCEISFVMITLFYSSPVLKLILLCVVFLCNHKTPYTMTYQLL